MIEIIGWIGASLLAFCGLPQAIKSFRDGNSDGISWMFILMWGFGELLGLIYIISLGAIPLVLNYSLNLILVSVILWFKMYPRKNNNGISYKKD
jgi:MtN3 and saliva related transmembrane protein